MVVLMNNLLLVAFLTVKQDVIEDVQIHMIIDGKDIIVQINV